MVHRVLSHNKRHKTRNGWYSEMEAPIYSIVDILILYSKNVLRRSGFYGSLFTAFANF